jgi:lipopolysaccharide exporter
LLSRIKTRIAKEFVGESLKANVFRGGVWLGSGSVIEQMFRFGRNILLARLLAPEAFGLMAIILAASSIIHTVTDIGIKEALIQNPRGSEKQYLDAAWWLAVSRSLMLCSMLFLLAPWIARFYGNVQLTPLLRVTSLTVLFDGALSSKAFAAVKEFKFGRWAAINHGGGICGVLITIVLSFFIRDVWALVIGYGAESVGRCALSFILCPHLPSLSWDMEAFRDLLKFSRGLFGLSLLNLVFTRTDIFVLAKLYTPAELGLYTMAVYLVQTPTTFIMNMLGQTLLPTYSKIRGEVQRENRILAQVTFVILLLGLPALAFIFFYGRSLLTVVYGYRYAALAPALIVASSVALLNLLNAQITTIFYARGLPQLHRRCVAIMAIMMIILIYPLSKRFGLVGGQLACLLSIVAGYSFQIARVREVARTDLAQYGKTFVVPFAISIAVVILYLFVRLIPILSRPIPGIIFGIWGCILAYALSTAVFFRHKERLTT